MPNQTNPLDELADIHLPDGVSWWPLAPGWWILIALAVIAAAAIYYWRRHQQRNAYRHLALQELQQAYQDLQQHASTSVYLQQLSNILRRTALSAYSTQFNASIKGDEWLCWLDAHLTKRLDAQSTTAQDSFAQGTGQALLVGPYQKAPQIDAAALQQLCVHWVQHHRNQWQKIKTPSLKKTADVKKTEATNV